jgi:hypothetical protein
MQQFIGPTLLASNEAQPRRKPFEIYDNRWPQRASTPSRSRAPRRENVFDYGAS